MAKVMFPKDPVYAKLAKELASAQGLEYKEDAQCVSVAGSHIEITRELIKKHLAIDRLPADTAQSLWLGDLFEYSGRITKMTDDLIAVSDRAKGSTSARLRQETADLLEECYERLGRKKAKIDIHHEAIMLYIQRHVPELLE